MGTPSANPVICALDSTDVGHIRTLCGQIRPHVGALKLGLEFFTANGPTGVQTVAQACNMPIFLDLKFHDIPNTVAKAIKATAGINAFMMTVHTAGGYAMLKAAAGAAQEVTQRTGKERPLIIGVTVLTSLDADDLSQIGVQHQVDDQVKRLAELAQQAGLDGVVCSPHEIEVLKAQCGEAFKLVVPGIRPAGAAAGDQKRIMTPKEAINKGADYLVIGRPITDAAQPGAAAKKIKDEL